MILSLLLACVVLGSASVVSNRQGFLSPPLAVLAFDFFLSLFGCLVLFYFLTSNASVRRRGQSLGGAVAGFFVLFTLFSWLTSDSRLAEPLDQLGVQDPSTAKRIGALADLYLQIDPRNEILLGRADKGLTKLDEELSRLARGTYGARSEELEHHLLPAVRGAKSEFFASQSVLLENFWSRHWSSTYLEENKKAINRGVDLRRVFIVAHTDEPQARRLKEIAEEHRAHSIRLRFLDPIAFREEMTAAELRDVLVVDGQFSGMIDADTTGRINELVFSFDRDLADRRRNLFLRQWELAKEYDEWSRGP